MEYFINENKINLSSIVFSTIDIEENHGKYFMSIRELNGFAYEAGKTIIGKSSEIFFDKIHERFVSIMRKRDFHVSKIEDSNSYDVYYVKSPDINRSVSIHPVINKLFTDYLSGIGVDKEIRCSDGEVVKYHKMFLETQHESIPFGSIHVREFFNILYLGVNNWIMKNKDSTNDISKMGVLVNIARFLGLSSIEEEIINLMKYINILETEKFLGNAKTSWDLLKNKKQSEFFRRALNYKPEINSNLHYLTTKNEKVIMRGSFLTFGKPFKLYVIIHKIIHEYGYGEYISHSCEELMFDMNGSSFGLQEIKHETEICGEYPILTIKDGELFDVGKSLK